MNIVEIDGHIYAESEKSKIDLTLMFGKGNELSSAEELEKLFPQPYRADDGYKFDSATEKWFKSHPSGAIYGTTICQCEHCGLMYKPSLGHSCKIMKTYRFKDEDGMHYCDGVSKEDAILLYTGHRISWASYILKNYKITRVYK